MILGDFRVSQRHGVVVVLREDFIEFWSVKIEKKSQPRSKRRRPTVEAPPLYKEAYTSPMLDAACFGLKGSALS